MPLRGAGHHRQEQQGADQAGLKYLLAIQHAGAIDVVDQSGHTHTLDAVEPIRNPHAGQKSTTKKVAPHLAGQTRGLAVGVEATCVAVAEAIVGKKYSGGLSPSKMKDLGLLNSTEVLAWGTAVADAMTKGGKRKHGTLDEATVAQAYATFLTTYPATAAKLAKKLGVNEFAEPKVGEAFVTEAVGVTGHGGVVNWVVDATGATTTELLTADATVRGGQRRSVWGNHAGAVVATSGGDKVTLENYARSGEDPAMMADDEIYYFAMYGPVTKPAQTWHQTWNQGTAPIANAVTGVIR